MEVAVPWKRLGTRISPHYHRARNGRGRPQMPLSAMLRIHFMQQWFGYSDPTMEEALYDIPMFRAFAGLDTFDDHLPDETTILRVFATCWKSIDWLRPFSMKYKPCY